MTTDKRQIRMILMREEDPYRQKRFERCSMETAEKLNIKICTDTFGDNMFHPGDLYFYDCSGREDTWQKEVANLQVPRSYLVLISDVDERWRDVLRCRGYDLVRTKHMQEDMRSICLRYLSEHNGYLYLPFHNKIKPILMDCICSISVMGNRITINTTAGSFSRHESLNSFIIRNDLMQWMIRINRSVLINPRNIQAVDAECVRMENGEIHYFSRRCGSSARDLLYRMRLKNLFSEN